MTEGRGPGRRKIAIATGDALTERLAGPGIRALNMALVLAGEHDVELVTTSTATLQVPGLTVRSVDRESLAALARGCDAVVVQGWVLHGCPELAALDTPLVCDLYDPLHLEALEQARDDPPPRRADIVSASVDVLNAQAGRGDFFLCASERQRTFWLGHLGAVGRINPATYDADLTLRALVDVAPFGIPSIPPRADGPAIKGMVPGIGPGDKVVLWGGGLYNWLDPVTVVQAVSHASRRITNLRLFFLGSGHPTPGVPGMRAAVEARQASDDLGLTGTHVFFNDTWVEHSRLGAYLLDADLGISAHPDHLEASLSYRARILDYLWAGLPVVLTKGDVLAELVEQNDLGRTVPAGSAIAMGDAIVGMLGDDDAMARHRANIEGIAGRLTWSQALVALADFCRDPRRAPDTGARPPQPRSDTAGRYRQSLRRLLTR